MAFRKTSIREILKKNLNFIAGILTEFILASVLLLLAITICFLLALAKSPI